MEKKWKKATATILNENLKPSMPEERQQQEQQQQQHRKVHDFCYVCYITYTHKYAAITTLSTQTH